MKENDKKDLREMGGEGSGKESKKEVKDRKGRIREEGAIISSIMTIRLTLKFYRRRCVKIDDKKERTEQSSEVLCRYRVCFSGCLEAFGGLGGLLVSRREHQNHL